MLKRCVSLLCLLLALALHGAEFLPDWQMVTLDGKSKPVVLKAEKNALSVDAAKVTGIRPDDRAKVRICGVIRSEADCIALLGIGADYYYALEVNGTPVSSTMKRGNSEIGSLIDPANQMQAVPLKKGDNRVSLTLRSGSAGFLVKMALFPASLEGLQRTINLHAFIPDEKVTAGPVLTAPEKESVSLFFETHGQVIATLQYREMSAVEWKTLAAKPKCGVQPSATFHRFKLKDLKPGKSYEYRTVLLKPFTEDPAVPGPAGSFTVPAADRPFCFFATNDTQIETVSTQKIMQFYRRALHTDRCAMIVHLGDMVSWTQSYRKEYFAPFIDTLNGGLPQLRPVVLVRGNHEYRGVHSGDWIDRFGSEKRTGYYSFRIGKVCFVVLDSGEDKSYRGSPLEPLFQGQEKYLEKEREWLEKYVKSEEFRTAEFRIVLAHAYPQVCEKFMARHIADMAGDLFCGKSPKYPIHLWMAGHTHRYQRTLPGTDRMLLMNGPAYAKRKQQPVQCRIHVQPEEIPFTVVVGDGPNTAPVNTGFLVECGKDLLTVTVLTPEGKTLDRFAIDRAGKLVKSEPAKELITLPMTRQP